MPVQFFGEEAAVQLLRYKEEGCPLPPPIVNLKREIALATALAKRYFSEFGEIDQGIIDYNVTLRRRLDRFYGLWGEGRL